MDIREIESVCAVDTYKNYSNAAYHIASSTGVISKHVAKVERELGISIFERASKSRPVELTEDGKQVIDYLHAIVRMYRCAMSTAKSQIEKKSETLTVGYMPRVGSFQESEILARFTFENPNIILYRKADYPPGLINMLLNGVVDAIFVPLLQDEGVVSSVERTLNDSDIEMFEVLQHNTLTVGLPDSHPLAKEELITRDMYKLLHNETFLLSNDQRGMRHNLSDGYLYDFFEFTDNMKIQYIDMTDPVIGLDMVKRGAGILIQSGITQRHMGEVNFIPVEGWSRNAVLYCIYRRSSKSKPLKRLVDCVKKFSEEYATVHEA